jgi:hypothetical protein
MTAVEANAEASPYKRTHLQIFGLPIFYFSQVWEFFYF